MAQAGADGNAGQAEGNQQAPNGNANAVALDAAVAAALAAAEEADDGDELAEIRIGKSFPIAFPALLVGHVVLHWLDRVKTEAQARHPLRRVALTADPHSFL